MIMNVFIAFRGLRARDGDVHYSYYKRVLLARGTGDGSTGAAACTSRAVGATATASTPYARLLELCRTTARRGLCAGMYLVSVIAGPAYHTQV